MRPGHETNHERPYQKTPIENGEITDADTADRVTELGEKITRRTVQFSVDPTAAPALD
jgi:hypothetical protein